MNKKIIQKIKDEINKNINIKGDSYAKFSNSDYNPIKISENNFNNFEESNSEKSVAFVDGGNLELINSANLSLNLIRTYYCIYKNNKRIQAKRQEFYALVYTEDVEGEIKFKAEFFETDAIMPDKDDLNFDSFDSTIKTGNNRIEISRIGDVIRRFTELKVAAEIVKDLESNDAIIMDGSLQKTFTNEEKYLRALYFNGQAKNITIGALSKTSSLMTDKGNAFVAVLDNFNKQGRWYYFPIVDIESEDHKANLFFVKFHEKSDYIFKFESYKNLRFDPNKIFGLLAGNSKDPIFLGYPYGLIEADKFSRISDNEIKYYLTTLMSEFGAEWKKLKPYLNSKNAHSILDSIS